MMMPLDRPAQMSRTDLLVAIIALLFLLAARPALAHKTTTTTDTAPTIAPLDPMQNPSYLNPGSSQSQRDANARRTRNRTSRFQPAPECRDGDTNCIEQRNRMNPTNQQTAPTFNR